MRESDPAPSTAAHLDFATRRSSSFATATCRAVNGTTSDSDPALSADGYTTTSDDTQPAVDADGSLGLATDRVGAMGMLDIFHSSNQDDAGFSTPAPEVEPNSIDDDWSPALSADGLQIFFASKRSGGSGGDDVYVATRSSLGAAFGAPTSVTELKTPASELPHWVSHDKCRLYLERSIGTSCELYVATRGP